MALDTAWTKWRRKYFYAGISHEQWPRAVEDAFAAGWKAAMNVDGDWLRAAFKAEHAKRAAEGEGNGEFWDCVAARLREANNDANS